MNPFRTFQRLALFPHSDYLAERWWHRLASVGFWAYLVWMVLKIYQMVIVESYANCHAYNANRIAVGSERRWDCGTGAINYATLSGSWVWEWPAIAGLVVVGLILFSSRYRVLLYIALGDKWKAL